MITIIHEPSHVAVLHGGLFYNTGLFDPPNYPMPAIRTSDALIIGKDDKPHWFVTVECYSPHWPNHWWGIII